MELDFPHFGLAALVVSVMLLLHTLLKQLLRKRRLEKLPPGPWKLPLIGNLHQVVAGGSLPWHTFRDLARKHGSIMHLQVGQVSTVVVSSPRLAKEVLHTHDLAFLDRPELFGTGVLFHNKSDLIFTDYGDFWRQMRKLCTLLLLSNTKVSSYSTIREEEVSNLVSSLQLWSSSASEQQPVNLSKKLSSLSSAIICRTAFGSNFKGQDELIPLIHDASALAGGLNVANVFPSLAFLNSITGSNRNLRKTHQKFDSVIEKMIIDYRSNLLEGKGDKTTSSSSTVGDENLLDALLRLQQSGGFGIQIRDTNIKGMILDVFMAGTETTSTTVNWAFSELLKNPQVMKKAQAEVRRVVVGGNKTINESDISKLNYLKMVVKETLRLHPPAPLLVPRQCREACEIDGYEVPDKTRVIVNVWAIGRDPCVWDDAETFKPERFENSDIDFRGTDFELLPFSAGRRICPGLSFGVSVIEIAMAKLLYHFDWKLPLGTNPEDLSMDENLGVTSKRKHDLYAIPVLWDGPVSSS